MDSADTYREISRLLEPHNKHGIELKPDTELAPELELDSVAAMNLIMEIEDNFEIDIPLNLLSDIHKVQDLVMLVHERIESG